jgi:predicted RNA-binding protein with PIN domain
MIKKYIIDGNNLIGKISELWSLQNRDRQLARIKLVKYLDQYFRGKKNVVSLHFDGFPAEAIPSSSCIITYSENRPADILIRKEIDSEITPKTSAVVSSDHYVQNYARVNSCKVIKSEEFAKRLRSNKKVASEEEITKSISDEEIKKLFGL